ncbi:MAG: ChbG/HpnK family deacetylase [Candidatus Latescibacteria bacterium]|nr:ChbG/HpnK family deacetylase [Candidatus Latescibacterota bacterium]
MSKTFLIVNADDFGANHAHNVAVVQAFTEGILTTAEIMVPSPWFAEGIAMAKKHRIPIGIHLTLTCEYQAYQFGPLTRAPELSLDGKGYVFFPKATDIPSDQGPAITGELGAQFDRMIAAGIQPTHMVDHMHACPRSDYAFSKSILDLYRTYRTLYADLDLLYPDNELYEVGRLPLTSAFALSSPVPFEEKKARFLQYIESISDGIHFARAHPAVDHFEMDAALAPDNWGTSTRYTDLLVLCDREVKARIHELGIRLINVTQATQITGTRYSNSQL